jgi:hypothetical protein
VNHSLTERAAVVLANVVHGADRAIDVGDANHALPAQKFLRFVGRGEFGSCGEFGEGHASAISSWQVALSVLQSALSNQLFRASAVCML